ncbi:hypothetical protein KRP22_013519 [Phytophthora ramorum]|nr:hypothetical protein KRP22_11311 [Phytophthora ramorum]
MRTRYLLALVLVLFAPSCSGLRPDDSARNAEAAINRIERTADNAETLDARNEEIGIFDLFKFKNPFRKNQALKTLSQKNLAFDTMMAVAQKNPASSRLKNPVFGKLKAVFSKKPAEITKKDVQLMQQTPGLSRAKSLLGKDPSKATPKDFKRVGTFLSKNRGNPDKYWNIFYGLICLAVLGVIVSIAFVGL